MASTPDTPEPTLTDRLLVAIGQLDAADPVDDDIWNLGSDAAAAAFQALFDDCHRWTKPELMLVVEAALRAAPCGRDSLRSELEAVAERAMARTARLLVGDIEAA